MNSLVCHSVERLSLLEDSRCIETIGKISCLLSRAVSLVERCRLYRVLILEGPLL